mmetsp:Transcript_38994/g.90313  ORF Transcript_38994/g.90313 Transcript_38994/m.90313 type:complete len:268 (+) Transcript_38994:101-904(+)|eukprot:CAMPEP_0179904748 /NCGR_PEP_ID=MMETSP0982-20121206/42137_1 /TAXON_ID=483367 /ORGANISM="non described non described, Strain CCMP 2436" /LENGTH=267 /DNA_ID=CAMNT_0021804731 /DNA_START=91 /DNA_END=894 /DNA_ORIENTATION=-
MAYTFKDSSIDKTYYKDYNKVDGQQAVLVGNWAEERALKESTGQMRSTQWVEPSSAMLQGVAEPSHTKMKGHPDMEDTTMRVFFHSDYIEPRDFKPASQLFREDKWRRYEDKGTGARTAMLECRAREMAGEQVRAEEAAEAAVAEQLLADGRVSETRANFAGAIPARGDDPSRGKRIMKTQDGAPAHRDSLFLVESGLLAPHLADYGAAASHFDVSNLPVEPVTYADSMYVTGQTKGEASGSYPRARNDYFSKPIELSKKPGVFLDD